MAKVYQPDGVRILVTGGTGSLGRKICGELDAQGHQPVVFARGDGDARFDSIRGDIRNIDELALAFQGGIGGVVHAAAAKRSRPTTEIIETNILGTKNLLDCCVRFGVPFAKLISSSEACYPIGFHVYGSSKFLMEQLAGEYAQRLDVQCLRLPSIWGTSGSLLSHWQDALLRGEDLPLFTYSGRAKHKFFVTLDQAAKLAAQLSGDKSKLITFPRARVVDVRTLAEILVEETDTKIVEMPMPGVYFEMLHDSYASNDVAPIDTETIHQILRELEVIPRQRATH